ncbi:MAG: N-6 DNA methylase [Planctomycetota bacterium]
MMKQKTILFTERPWQSRDIFSTHYLTERLLLSGDKYWPSDDKVKPVYDSIKAIYDKHIVRLWKADEPDNEDIFITPVFELLGFGYAKRKAVPGAKDTPDYLLYPDKTIREKLLGEPKKEQYAEALTIAEAKRWDHSLDEPATGTRKESKTKSGEYPYQQIRRYLDRIESPNIRWGILTNGKEWRLYLKEGPPRRFFEISLEQDKQFVSLEYFRYFYALFRPEAFIPDGSGRCPLDDIYNQSLQFYEEVEKDLKEKVFECLESLAEGFISYSDNNLSTKQSDLDEIYKNSLIFLYRILFVLNAEARDLLSTHPQSNYYKNCGLQRLKEEIKGQLNTYTAETTKLYHHLSELFHLVNNGSSEMKIPAYNGGLFDPERYQFLEQKKLPDKTVAGVIYKLAFREDKKKEVYSLDYKELGERHLGSIYEAILEQKLVKKNGSVTLVNDKGERKATGAYFTPDYIVKYIVQNTVGSLVKQIDKNLCQSVKSVVKDDSFANEILKLKILDPAMGSGHFLVETLDYLAEEIASHPTTQSKTEQGKDEDEVKFWKRRIVESCIFGVDIKDLAVELAKLSLWLKTVDRSQPLSFLDHHLKPGNSLIGAKIQDLRSLPTTKTRREKTELEGIPKLDIFPEGDLLKDLSHSVLEFLRIAMSPSTERKHIKEKEKLFAGINKEHLDKYRRVANLWTSVYFGNEITSTKPIKWVSDIDGKEMTFSQGSKITLIPGIYNELSKHILNNARVSNQSFLKLIDNAEAITKDKHFFHWELEFPEVFFNEDGSTKTNPGFDAVIGNPPHGGELDPPEKMSMLKDLLPSYKVGNESAAIFALTGHELLRSNSGLGFVMPKPLSYNDGWTELRKFIYEKSALKNLIDLGCTFEGQLQEQIILIIQKVFSADKNNLYYKTGWLNKSKTTITETSEVPVNIYQILTMFPLALTDDEIYIYRKLSKSEKYSTLAFISAHRGLPFKYLSSKGTPAIEKRDIERYVISDETRYFVKETEVPPSLLNKINKPKIIAQRILSFTTEPYTLLPKAVVDCKGLLCTETSECIYLKSRHYSSKFICALLNSGFISWFLSRFVYTKRFETSKDFDAEYIKRIIIPRIAFVTPAKERERIVNKAKDLYKRGK